MRMRPEHFAPMEMAASAETEAAFQRRLAALLSTPGLKLRRIAALLDAESYLVEEKTKKGATLRFDVERYAQDQRRAGHFARLPEAYRPTSSVILPPGEGEIRAGDGREPYREPEVIHRTKAVMDMLGRMDEPYELVDGTTTPNMMRRLSYTAFVLKERGKLLLVNDEEGNATYVVHHLRDEEETKDYLGSRKDDLRDLMKLNPGLISVLEFRGGMEAYVDEMRELIERSYAAEPALEESITDASRETKKALPSAEEEEVVLPAPAGWMTRHGLVEVLGKSRDWIQRRMEGLNLIEGRDVGIYLEYIGGNRVFHYSPKVVERLRELAQEHEPAPAGWMTARGLHEVLEKSEKWIQKQLKELSLVEGVDTRIYLTTDHKAYVHYSPKVVERLRELVQEHETAPKGWITVRGLHEVLEKSDNWIQKRLKELPIVEGVDTRIYLTTDHHVYAHYSPWVVERLLELAQEHEPAPEGWMTRKGLTTTLNKSESWILNRLQGLAPVEEQDVKVYLDRTNKSVVHYSPKIVEQLRKLAQEHDPAPEGWVTVSDLMRLFGKSSDWIGRRIQELAPVEGRDVRLYLDRTNNLVVHYNPKIVERLRELAQEHESAPEGWMTMRGLTTTLKKSESWIQNRLQIIAPVEGQGTKVFFHTGGHPLSHYSPKVVERLRELAQEHESAPEGWMTARAIRKTLNKSQRWTQNRLQELASVEGRDFKGYLDVGGRRCVYYSPKVVKQLKRMLEE